MRVPIRIFFLGTFFGVSVQTFIAVKAGLTLYEITDPSEVINYKVLLTLLSLSFLSLIPTLKPVQNWFTKVFLGRPCVSF